MLVERWTSPAGKRRLLTRLDPAEATLYHRVTEIAIPRPPVGARSFGSAHPRGRRPWHQERVAWRAEVRGALDGAGAVHVSDVADCYPSIGATAIRMAARWASGDPEPLLAFLERMHEGGAVGLPIGPDPSSVIADAVLAIADQRATTAGIAPIRWVDDVVFAGDQEQVARAARVWRGALRDLGLREHEGKRRSIPAGPEAVGKILGPCLAARSQRVIMRSS
jgi:hypothetical protein